MECWICKEMWWVLFGDVRHVLIQKLVRATHAIKPLDGHCAQILSRPFPYTPSCCHISASWSAGVCTYAELVFFMVSLHHPMILDHTKTNLSRCCCRELSVGNPQSNNLCYVIIRERRAWLFQWWRVRVNAKDLPFHRQVLVLSRGLICFFRTKCWVRSWSFFL